MKLSKSFWAVAALTLAGCASHNAGTEQRLPAADEDPQAEYTRKISAEFEYMVMKGGWQMPTRPNSVAFAKWLAANAGPDDIRVKACGYLHNEASSYETRDEYPLNFLSVDCDSVEYADAKLNKAGREAQRDPSDKKGMQESPTSYAVFQAKSYSGPQQKGHLTWFRKAATILAKERGAVPYVCFTGFVKEALCSKKSGYSRISKVLHVTSKRSRFASKEEGWDLQ